MVVCTELKIWSGCTREQMKLVKEKLPGKTCSFYTRASKATKELVKENFVVPCAGLNCTSTLQNQLAELSCPGGCLYGRQVGTFAGTGRFSSRFYLEVIKTNLIRGYCRMAAAVGAFNMPST